MKILIFGKNGQLGQEICKITRPIFETIELNSDECNFSDDDNIHKTILFFKPDIIINCSAYTKVDLAEKEKALCYKINSSALETIGKAAYKIDALVIHFSTDYVFDGLKVKPYFEIDKTNPLNEYGKSKLSGELLLKKYNNKNIIIRTSWVFSNFGKNFFKTILNKIKYDNSISVINDQIGSPTSTYLISKMVVYIIHKYSSDRVFPFGTFNISSKGETTWYGFAKEIISKNKIINGNEKKLILIPITSNDYPSIANRPKYSVLSGNSFRDTFGIEFPCWKDQINEELFKYEIL